MAITNNWNAYGVVLEEPKIMKLSEGKIMCRTVLAVGVDHQKANAYLPIVAYNKKAHIFAQTVHKGATICCKGVMVSKESITSQQAKVLVGLMFKITDFVVLIKEPVKTNELDFVDVVQLFNPENFMEEENDDK